MRYTYFPRSFAGSFDQTPSCAFRAAFTALSTSSDVASATSASFFSLAGLIVSKYSPLVGGTNFPLMKRSYFGWICTFAVSGAGAYFQSVEKFSDTEGADVLIAHQLYHRFCQILKLRSRTA